ncbi:hypothetical protein QCD71_19155 [Sphingomonas sp. PsM26]|nr:hypothetical protein [Sphingomonas sp. PsM26]
MAKVDATITATMACFTFFAIAAVWSFAARTVSKAAIGLIAAAIVPLVTLGLAG